MPSGPHPVFVQRGHEFLVAGPLWDWLTPAEPELLVETLPSTPGSNRLMPTVPPRVRSQPQAWDRIARAAGELQEQMRVLLVECRDTKSERANREAKDLCPRWIPGELARTRGC